MTKKIESFKDLIAWQRAHQLAILVYRVSQDFPKEEKFGLTSQVRRSAVSVASNIAEGYGRGTRVDYMRFLRMARGSLYEMQTQMLLATDLGFLMRDRFYEVENSATECGRIIAGLLRSLEPRF